MAVVRQQTSFNIMASENKKKSNVIDVVQVLTNSKQHFGHPTYYSKWFNYHFGSSVRTELIHHIEAHPHSVF